MLSSVGNKNSEKTTICLISKKATLHVQHTFFVHFFANVLHDHNLKLSSYTFYGGHVAGTCSCSHFFNAAHVHLGGR